MLLGRDIGLQDTETSPKVAVINEIDGTNSISVTAIPLDENSN